ncbi:Succinyl-CoA ligase [Paramyrothecium foliicola]|nr:Succinyl-CoA ligase [Paramyrothecium foliicola]
MVWLRASGGPLARSKWVVQAHQIRRLTLHEYQALRILQDYQIPVPRGQIAETAEEAGSIARELGGKCALKAQVLKDGRDKGYFENGLHGGVQSVNNPKEAQEMASKMLGHRLQTEHSTDNEPAVRQLLVTQTFPFEEQWYVALTIDRERYGPILVISKRGGVDVAKLAQNKSSELFTFPFSMSLGITTDLIMQVSKDLQLPLHLSDKLGNILKGLFEIFKEKDASILEINPLVHSSDGILTCLDAKFTFDDAAQRRQPDLFALRDKSLEVPEEVEAERYGLIYVRMAGNIGNVVNGAGLAMATNDAIHLNGGSSANFLDAGGQATKETMQQAFRIVLMDDRVKAIIVNVYGGITRCDMIAESIIGAAKQLGSFPVPVVVRLQGTNSEKGLQLLREADLGLHVEADFGKAAQLVVELANRA